MNVDYYELLSVTRTASGDEIKSSYRKLALKFHPDRNKEPGAAEQFAKINEAYSVLSDDEKRAHYDRFGSAPGASGMPGGDPFGQAGFDPMDIFEQLFGGAGRDVVALLTAVVASRHHEQWGLIACEL